MQAGETLAQYGQRWRSAPAGRWPLTWAGGSTGSVGAVRAADGADKPVRPDLSWTADRAPDSVRGGVGNGRRRQAEVEVAVGSLLVLAMAAGGVYFTFRPASGSVDGWFLDVISASNSPFFSAATSLRYPVIIIIGSIVASGVAFRRDRPRAVACLIGPPLALFLAESLIKPAVGRTLGGVLSYPSGSTVGAAALATAAVLATPARWRVITVVAGSAYAVWVSVAVTTLRLHYPTDALAGLAFGAGVVLLADGLARMIADSAREASRRRGAGPADPRTLSRVGPPPVD